MKCRNCGIICNDYIVIDLCRIKEGEVLIPFEDNGSKIIFCMDCGDKIVKIINDSLEGWEDIL